MPSQFFLEKLTYLMDTSEQGTVGYRIVQVNQKKSLMKTQDLTHI